jgi:hypothetical protein
MPRGYYKEPGVTYGRPKTKIVIKPPRFFKNYDEKMRGWDGRQFLRELVTRQAKHDWKKERPEWAKGLRTFERGRWYTSKERPPWYSPGKPLTDLDEINAFLCRLPPVVQIEVDHALDLGMILIAVDPNTPDLAKRLRIEAEKIRKAHPSPIKKRRGRPNKSGDITVIPPEILNAWRTHRIVALLELRLRGYDPQRQRKQLAAWLYSEQKNQRARGEKLDQAVKLLDDALAAARAIDAQTR